MTSNLIPVFDGHNDTLLNLYLAERGGGRSFFERSAIGHLDLPRAKEGGFAGGFFAIFTPSDAPTRADIQQHTRKTDHSFAEPLAPLLDRSYALDFTLGMLASLFKLEEQSQGQVRIVRTVNDIEECLRSHVLAAEIHIEGADAIDPGLDALYILHAAGLRSLGIVWSRATAFGFGVPFAFPSSPDTGPGLTTVGRELVRVCNQLGILVDLSHLNEQGFWDVEQISNKPLVATHSAVHAICPSTRNLTDKQIDAIGASDGLIGLNFAVYFIRDDGADDPETPLDQYIKHIDYIVERIGIEHIALGSDFDGTRVARELGDAAGLPRLLDALRRRGYDDADLRKIAYENWLRVLRQTWKD